VRKVKATVSLVLSFCMLLSIGSFPTVTKAASEFNYADAFAKSILFYEANWCGEDAGNNRLKWRGPCHVNDGSDVGVDLTGGFHDCGDHVKFGLPQTYAASTLGWAYYEFKDTFIQKGQDKYMLNINKHFCDYFMKCFVNDTTFYYQVGDGDTDHSYWGPPEMQDTERPTFYVANPETPGSDVAGNAAAALALMYINYKDIDLEYSEKCLDTAIRLYNFGKKYRGNSKAQTYYTPANYFDELMWGAVWLCVATGDKSYLDDVETFMTERKIGGDKVEYYNHWTHCWDDVFGGVFLMMSQLSDKPKYKEATEENLDFWMNELKTTPGGLRYLHEWACLKYAASEAFLALVYNKYSPNQKYVDFAKSQIDYILGDNPRKSSYVVGFGENYPKFPHHRAASGRLEGELTREDKDDPERHILYGALVGGPKDDDTYVDDINQYVYTEVGLDYNAGFVGAMAGMTQLFGADQEPEETPDIESGPDEYSFEAQVTYENSQQSVINANIYNVNMTPPHFDNGITFRYFVDLSEFYENGYSVKNVKTGISFTDNGAKITGLMPWDESKHIYFAEIYWPDTVKMFGKSQVQFKIYTTNATCFDPSNDFSRDGLPTEKTSFLKTENIPVYKNGKLVWGKEPYRDPSITFTPTPVVTPTPVKDVVIQMYNSTFFSSNQLAPKFCIMNPTTKTLDLTTVKIRYYYTIDGDKEQTYSCDYTSLGEGNITGTFVKMEKPTDNADHYFEIAFKTGKLEPEESLYFAFRIWKNDWSDMNQENDYSYNDGGGDYEDWTKVTGYINGKLEWGDEPGTVIATPAPTPTDTPNVIYGDVTGDGDVNAIDFGVMRKYLLGFIDEMPADNWEKSGDLNTDGSVNAIDFAILRKYLLSFITRLPV
jgi:endoglucanase